MKRAIGWALVAWIGIMSWMVGRWLLTGQLADSDNAPLESEMIASAAPVMQAVPAATAHTRSASPTETAEPTRQAPARRTRNRAAMGPHIASPQGDTAGPPRAGPASASPTPENPFPPTPGGRALHELVQSSVGVGPGTDLRHAAALAEARKHADEIVPLLVEALEADEPGPGGTRWLATELLGELETSEAVPKLAEIAQSPLDPAWLEGNGDAHDPSLYKEEATVRYAAIRGLEAMAVRGHQDAIGALEEVIADGHPATLPAAMMAYLESGPRRERQARARPLLAEEDWHLLHLRRLQDGDLPPASPERSADDSTARAGSASAGHRASEPSTSHSPEGVSLTEQSVP